MYIVKGSDKLSCRVKEILSEATEIFIGGDVGLGATEILLD